MAEISKKSLLQHIQTDLNIRALNNTNSQVRRPGCLLYTSPSPRD